MIVPDNLIALPPSMEVAVAYPPYGLSDDTVIRGRLNTFLHAPWLHAHVLQDR